MDVRPATAADLGALLALIADYQRFYAGQRPRRGAQRFTALDNRPAQRLYERLGEQRSAWFEYEIPTVTG